MQLAIAKIYSLVDSNIYRSFLIPLLEGQDEQYVRSFLEGELRKLVEPPQDPRFSSLEIHTLEVWYCIVDITDEKPVKYNENGEGVNYFPLEQKWKII